MVEKKIKIVTIGGGTGSFTLLSELRKRKESGENLNISAVVAMSDSGGSTGILRDDYGVLPAGDVRQCLVALSPESEFLRKLFLYRYDSGFLDGHNFGNIFLSTIEKMSDSFPKAIRSAEKLLRTAGKTYPITMDNNELIIKQKNGKEIFSEKNIDSTEIVDIDRIFLSTEVKINEKIPPVILDADYIVIAPGNFYNSIVPNFLVKELAQLLKESSAKVIFITNLTSKRGHTDNFTVDDFITELYKHSECSGFVDYVLYNNENNLPQEVKDSYLAEGSQLIQKNDTGTFDSIQFIGDDFVSREVFKKSKSDIVRRALVRHNTKKLFDTIFKL